MIKEALVYSQRLPHLKQPSQSNSLFFVQGKWQKGQVDFHFVSPTVTMLFGRARTYPAPLLDRFNPLDACWGRPPSQRVGLGCPLWVNKYLQINLHHFRVEFFFGHLHCLMKLFSLSRVFIPPHRVQFAHPAGQSGWHMGVLLALHFVDSIVIRINVDDKPSVNGTSYLFFNTWIPNRFETEPMCFLSINFIQNITNNFWEMKIDQSCRREPNIILRVSFLELYLVMIQELARLVFASNIDQNVTLGPDLRIPAPQNNGVLELPDIVFEHAASQDIVTVESAIMGAYFPGPEEKSAESVQHQLLSSLKLIYNWEKPI